MKSSRLTQRIADEAARLLARGEAASLDAARRRVGGRIGVRDAAQLPGDAQISEALRAYRTLFGAPEAAPSARRLALATDAMRLMEAFSPELVEDTLPIPGPDERALRILVYSEDPDAPLHSLLETRRRYRVRRDRLLGPGQRVVDVDVLAVPGEPLAVEFWPLPEQLHGTPLRDSALGDPLSRRSLAQVLRLNGG